MEESEKKSKSERLRNNNKTNSRSKRSLTTSMDKHIAYLMNISDSHLTIVDDNAGGTSLCDPRIQMRLDSSFHSSSTSFASPRSDTWRKESFGNAGGSRRSPRTTTHKSLRSGRGNGGSSGYSSGHHHPSRSSECRWENEERFSTSPSCPLRSPEGSTGSLSSSLSRRKVHTRDLLLSLPVDIPVPPPPDEESQVPPSRGSGSPVSMNRARVAAIAGAAIGVVRLEGWLIPGSMERQKRSIPLLTNRGRRPSSPTSSTCMHGNSRLKRKR